jgi:hypothetical protein
LDSKILSIPLFIAYELLHFLLFYFHKKQSCDAVNANLCGVENEGAVKGNGKEEKMGKKYKETAKMENGNENNKNGWNEQKELKQNCISHVVSILFAHKSSNYVQKLRLHLSLESFIGQRFKVSNKEESFLVGIGRN